MGCGVFVGSSFSIISLFPFIIISYLHTNTPPHHHITIIPTTFYLSGTLLTLKGTTRMKTGWFFVDSLSLTK
eukprot:gnl/Chilomastix_caulleri/1038.p2 GENE.gnl/Chilomastix_caulleri/1038~~gnl/Chilomastix_caulleri/1038.p2  ORF type:complete len:72 (-),score=13.20 gnl/Chilomastix_caulleri/1038:470-685(-)